MLRIFKMHTRFSILSGGTFARAHRIIAGMRAWFVSFMRKMHVSSCNSAANVSLDQRQLAVMAAWPASRDIGRPAS